MSHAFAISLTRPHDAYGLPKSIGRRMPRGIVAWNIALVAMTVCVSIVYVVQVNLASAKSYTLREKQQKVEAVKSELMIMQDKLVTLSSMQSLNARAEQLGFAPIDRLEFLNPAAKMTAMAR